MGRVTSRRDLLRGAAGIGVAVWVAGPQARAQAPSERLNIACVGVTGRGGDNLGEILATGQNVVALCDVDDSSLDRALERLAKAGKPAPERHNDFRRMLERKDLDAVIVSTPDHTHAVATVAAMKSGRHAYCEKPLTHTVHEARVMIETAAKGRRATQMGTQIHAGDNYRRVVELVQSGTVGAVKEVHVWCGANWGGGDRPKETPACPSRLHWDLWLGPAPERPYHPTYHPANWRRWWDFGGGSLADMACHYLDLPFWALELGRPLTVEAEGPPVHPETCPMWLIVRYTFPARGGKPPVALTWYDGGRKPDALKELKFAEKAKDGSAREVSVHQACGSGVLFVGEKGSLVADYGNRRLFPEAAFKDVPHPAPTIPASVGHHKEWVEACKTGKPTTCRFDYSGVLTETVLLGNVAYRTGKKIAWDAEAMQAKGCPEADALVRKEYRKGWAL
jgi:predicted dehydrogenase